MATKRGDEKNELIALWKKQQGVEPAHVVRHMLSVETKIERYRYRHRYRYRLAVTWKWTWTRMCIWTCAVRIIHVNICVYVAVPVSFMQVWYRHFLNAIYFLERIPSLAIFYRICSYAFFLFLYLLLLNLSSWGQIVWNIPST